MMTTDKAYDKFYKLLNQIEADIPPSEQYELYMVEIMGINIQCQVKKFLT